MRVPSPTVSNHPARHDDASRARSGQSVWSGQSVSCRLTIVVKAKLILAGLETVFDVPALPFHRDQRLDAGASRAPSGEVGALAISQIAADQQAAGPQPALPAVMVAGIKIGQLQIPLVLPFPPARPDGTFAGLAQSYRRGPFVPSPPERRCQAAAASPCMISSAVPDTTGLPGQELNWWFDATPST